MSFRAAGRLPGMTRTLRRAGPLLGTSLLARLPLAMLGLGLLVHTHRVTGSFAAAGAVSGAYALAVGTAGPLLGRLVDRRGQTVVVSASAAVSAVLLAGVAVLPREAPLAALVALAAGIGTATPPVGACVRALLPGVLDDAASTRAVFAVESSALELTFVAGPPLVLGLGALWSTRAALGIAGAVLLAGSVAFAAQPASRSRRPAPAASATRAGTLRAPALRALVLVLAALGVVFGAVEVGVTASAGAGAGAAPLLAVWGAGSLAGGVLAARLGGGARTPAGLAALLAALAAGHGALALAAGSRAALTVVLFAAGATIAPTYASVYALVEDAAPAGAVTEAFAWLATAVQVGTAAGAAAGGALVAVDGPAAAFGLAAAAGVAALAVAGRRIGSSWTREPCTMSACPSPTSSGRGPSTSRSSGSTRSSGRRSTSRARGSRSATATST
jgi:MFS family permease